MAAQQAKLEGTTLAAIDSQGEDEAKEPTPAAVEGDADIQI